MSGLGRRKTKYISHESPTIHSGGVLQFSDTREIPANSPCKRTDAAKPSGGFNDVVGEAVVG